MHSCNHNCASCGGCAAALELTQGEIDLLMELAQFSFLPVARRTDDMVPVYLEQTDRPWEEYSLILQCLEKKGLIDLDYRMPLTGFDWSAYRGFPVHGSMALTQRGQTVVEMLEVQGIQ